MTAQDQKFNVELKQTMKGIWHVNSLKINASDMQELDLLIEATVPFLQKKIERMNSADKYAHEKYPQKPDFVAAAATPIVLSSEENILFEKLRLMRTDFARTENVPPYFILHDSTLKRIAKAKPKTKQDLLNIDGMGEKNTERYGIYFLKVVEDHLQRIPT